MAVRLGEDLFPVLDHGYRHAGVLVPPTRFKGGPKSAVQNPFSGCFIFHNLCFVKKNHLLINLDTVTKIIS